MRRSLEEHRWRRRRYGQIGNVRERSRGGCMKASACVSAVLFALASGSSLQAQFSVGTWVQTAPMKGLTMNVDQCCNGGRRLTFYITPRQQTPNGAGEERFDSSDAPR